MKILTVVGARPNFMKAAPIVRAIERFNQRITGSLNSCGSTPHTLQHVLVHTGQHYDKLMSDSFFADLSLQRPDVYLGVGSESHAVQTADILRKFEGVLDSERPDVVVVVGDVNSTLACALVTAKISPDSEGRRPLLAHVEAGLRSFDRTMPEEHNRVLTDHLSDILFVTEPSGVENLKRESIPAERIHFVGNTMIDSLLAFKDKSETSAVLERVGLSSYSNENGHRTRVIPYALLTLHRPANVDNSQAFVEILEGLQELAESQLLIFPCHPRTRKRISEFGLLRYFKACASSENARELQSGIRIIDPLGYLDFLCLMKKASLVLTDSGGIQEETTCLGVPCVTLRENTERPVTVEIGTNIIGGTQRERIRTAIRHKIQCKQVRLPENWDGQAATRILEVLLRACDPGTSRNLLRHASADAHD